VAYDSKARDFAFGFYAQGLSKEKALREIRKLYPGFSGSTWDDWEARYAWRERRAKSDATLAEFNDLCRNTARALMLELNEIRRQLYTQIQGGKFDNQTVYAFTSVTKQISELARQHLSSQDPARVAMETLRAAFEKFLAGLREIDGLAKPLESRASDVGQLVEKIGVEFGAEALR
jgi:hypothetical protein